VPCVIFKLYSDFIVQMFTAANHHKGNSRTLLFRLRFNNTSKYIPKLLSF
jgi:hypothetical protein